MKFTKIHGLGNDYIYINDLEGKINEPNQLSKVLSNRHLGIGADGIILLLKSESADFKMRIFNADGSEAEMCGNGIRGLAKYIYEHHLSKKTKLLIETNCGIKEINLNVKSNKISDITVDMGKYSLLNNDIPVVYESDINCINKEIVIDNNIFYITAISVGNPHCVIFVDDLNKINVSYLGNLIENNPMFPHKTNVEFVQIIDKNNIIMKVWERGSGETLSCGTGATASVIAGVITKRLNNDCNVHMLHGILNIYVDTKENKAYLTGPSEKVFDGSINTKKLIKK